METRQRERKSHKPKAVCTVADGVFHSVRKLARARDAWQGTYGYIFGHLVTRDRYVQSTAHAVPCYSGKAAFCELVV